NMLADLALGQFELERYGVALDDLARFRRNNFDAGALSRLQSRFRRRFLSLLGWRPHALHVVVALLSDCEETHGQEGSGQIQKFHISLFNLFDDEFSTILGIQFRLMISGDDTQLQWMTTRRDALQGSLVAYK